jgi:Tol biopolymer transport system component
MILRGHFTTLTAATCILTLLAAGPATATSAGSNALFSPRTSGPDGRIIAGAAGPGYIVSMLPDGSDRQRIHEFPRNTRSAGIDVTPDGSQIVAAFGQNTTRDHIYTVGSNGTDFKQVSHKGDDTEPTYSPSGGRIAFSRTLDATDTLMRMRAGGGHLRELTTGAEPKPQFVSWSPDGDHIAFIKYGRKTNSIVLTNTKGTWFRFLRSIPSHRGYFYTLNWSPDSTKIIYAKVRYSHSHKITNTKADLWTVSVSGSSVTRITNTPRLWEESPAYSPDGTAIACSTSTGRWIDVVVMDADGQNRSRIDTPKADETDVAWGG